MGGTDESSFSVDSARKYNLWAQNDKPPDKETFPPFEGEAALKPADRDAQRLDLARGIRSYHAGDLAGARSQFNAIPGHPLARNLTAEIGALQEHYQKKPFGDLIKALILDASVVHSYSKEEEGRLLEAADSVEALFLQGQRRDLQGAITQAKAEWNLETLASWEKFERQYLPTLNELHQAFQETDSEILAKNCLWLAGQFRGKKLGGTAWLLAHLAAQNPSTKSDAESLRQNLEGQRVSAEYLISDFFNQGGSSLAYHLLAVAPAVGLTRKLYRARPLVALLAGGPIHYVSTKTLMAVTGYDGRILPRSFGELAGGLGTSYLEVSSAIYLSNRFFWKHSPVKASSPILSKTPSAGALRKTLALGKKIPSLTWWTTKTSLKLGTITTLDLGAQYLSHLTGMSNMTPRGLPQYLMPLFSGTQGIRREVAQGYKVREKLIAGRREEDQPGKWALPGGTDLEATIDSWLARVEFSGDPGISEMLLAELYSATLRGDFALNIQRWILKKIETGHYPAANVTFERQKIPIRVQSNGRLCLLESIQYPCAKLP